MCGLPLSGKSTFAEQICARLSQKNVIYIATGIAFDEEMKERIKKQSSGMPSARRDSSRLARKNSGRTGKPVSSTRARRGRYCAESAKVTATSRTNRASKRVVIPG
ncbi:MAG: bifunctional adenosylcobinamide kinase/adenosylcobinamide-phosphate guanylyltransferase, partial [Firmicutes bacterium]|nr:bifunctional adenosylcobinamide kinase/adenosylcobinamide-phosphate guanylyltransferase [Bacillota bacterium]